MEKKIESIILEALGEASAVFMSQEVKGTEIVMPTEELTRIAQQATAEIERLRGEAAPKTL